MTVPLTVSCFSKIQIGSTFLVLAHLGSPGQRAIKRVSLSLSLCTFSWLPAFIFLICMFCCLFYISYHCYTHCLQCFNAVGWAAGRASGLWKTEWWGAGMVICLKWVADLHMAQLMPLLLTISCYSKIQIGFTFLVPAHPGSHGKGPLNVCVCACVRAIPTAFNSVACMFVTCFFQ